MTIIQLLLLTLTLLLNPPVQNDDQIQVTNDPASTVITQEAPVVTPTRSEQVEITTNTTSKTPEVETSDAETPDTQPTTYEVATEPQLTQLDKDAHDLLARLVTAESRGEPFEGKVAVAEVVLNRIASDEFPNSLYEVIYQTNQFQPVTNGMINEPATDASRQAVDEALNHSNIAHDALFFYNKQTAESRWLDQFPIITQIGNHTFK